MFTRLFGLVLLMLFVGVTMVKAQEFLPPTGDLTLGEGNIELVTPLSDVCDSMDLVDFKIVGFGEDATFSYNYDGTGNFPGDSTFALTEGTSVDIQVVIETATDTMVSNPITFKANLVDSIKIQASDVESPKCGGTQGSIKVNFTGGYTDLYGAPADAYRYLYVSEADWIAGGAEGGFADYMDDAVLSSTAARSAGTYFIAAYDYRGEGVDPCLVDLSNIAAWDTAVVAPASVAPVVDTIYTDSIACANGTASIWVEVSEGAGDTLIVQLWDADALTVFDEDTIPTVTGIVEFMNVPEGSYYASVIDTLGCDAESDSTINLVAPAEVAFEIEITDVTCAAPGTGAIDVAITNYVAGSAAGAYAAMVVSADSTYEWVESSANDSIIEITGLDAVYYALYVKDVATGCDSVPYRDGINGENRITLQADGEIKYVVMADSIECYGDSTWVSIDSITGGNNSGYEYMIDVVGSWDTTSSWLLPAGNYTVSVQNATGVGCDVPLPIEVVQPDTLMIDGIQTIEPTCYGGNDGLIIVDVIGGSGTYQYSLDSATWYNNHALTAEAGTYTVYVRDLACNQITDMQAAVEIDSLTEFTVEWDESDTMNVCYGDSTYADIDYNHDERDGENREITLFVTQDIDSVFVGGTAVEDMPNNGDDYPYLGAGTYYVWAADNFECISSNYDTLVVLQPDELKVTASVTEHATCNDDNDGIITIEAPDNYDWTNLKYILTNTYGGAYTTDPAYMTAMPDSVVQVQAAAGPWFAVLYDTYCGVRAISEKMVVKSYEAVVISDTALVVNDIECYGDSVGSFTIAAATGGSGNLVYTLYKDDKTEADTVSGYIGVTDTTFTNLKAGYYFVEVKDLGGCDGDWSDTIKVEQPEMLIFDVEETPISCFGAANGMVALYVRGGNAGQPMYKLGTTSWQAMEDTITYEGDIWWTANVTITDPGTYDVWAKDTLGCTAPKQTFTILEPDPIVISIDTIVNATYVCTDNGGVEVSVTGGNYDTYDFYLFNADSTVERSDDDVSDITFTGLPGDTYTLEVTDRYGKFGATCVMSETIVITQPDTITAEAAITEIVACKDGADGEITVSNIMGGTGSYELSISPTPVTLVQDSNVFSGLPADKYVITITDLDEPGGCPVELDTVMLDEAEEYLELSATRIQHLTCKEPAKFSVQATGGEGPYMYATALSELPEHVLVPPAIDSSAWQSDSIFNDITEPGTWIVWVMDARGCIVGGEFDENDMPVNGWRVPIHGPSVVVDVVATVTDLPKCNGETTAMIVVDDANVSIVDTMDLESTDRGYTVSINGIAGDTLANVGAGTYVVVVTDTLSECIGTDTVVIEDPLALEAELHIVEGNFTCPDAVEGFIKVTFPDTLVGTGDLEYQLWRNDTLKTDWQPNNQFLTKIGNSYQVVVRDANECEYTTESIDIERVEPIMFDMMDVTCSGDTAASVKVSVTGEEGRLFKVMWTQYEIDPDTDYESEWFTQEDGITLKEVFMFDNESLVDQHYEVWVVDSIPGADLGCISEPDTVTFDQMISDELTQTVVVGEVNGCGTDVTITPAGGVAPYTVMINGEVAMLTDGVITLGGGEQIITVMDAHECSPEVADTLDLDYPMSMDTLVNMFVGDTTEFVYGTISEILTAEEAGVVEYTFYNTTDSTCTEEVVVTVDAVNRVAPAIETVTPLDTVETNHTIFTMVFENEVMFNESVMGYLTVTKKDSTEATLEIPITEDMVDGNTITVDYDYMELGAMLDVNTTYTVAVDSGIVTGDGLPWDGETGAWEFTTGADYPTDVEVLEPETLEFKVYPNPFNDFIRIENADKLDRVVVSNIAGQRVLDIEYPSYEIRTGNLTTGVYVVTLISNDEIVKSERIIKK